MGYQIAYEITGEAKRVDLWKIRLKYFGIITISVLLIISFLWISGADWAVTVSAMEAMAETLSQGEDFAEAFSTFCIDVLQGAECG